MRVKWAYAAFVWSIVFLIPHVYWASGGTLGYDDQPVEGVLAVINYAAIVLTIIAALLALALVQPWGARFPRRLLLGGSIGAAMSLSLRGAVGLIQDLLIVLGRSDEDIPTIVLIFEPLFLVGGILFGLAAWQYHREHPAT